MREREIIEQDRTYKINYTVTEEAQIKSLEVLLDIRDLLTPKE